MRNVRKEFEEAYEQYADELFRHCALRLKDRERALEITQEAFLRAWRYVERGERVEGYRPFLYRTLRNLIIDEYRRNKTVSLEGLVKEEEGETLDTILPADETNTLTAAIERFEGAQALEALKEMPEPYREALTLRFVESLSPREIAEYIGVSENVVSVRIHRGLKKMRALLEAKELSQ